MSDDDLSLAEKLKHAREAFAHGLSEKVTAIEAVAAKVLISESNPETLDELLFDVHRLVGSASTMGFEGVSLPAAELENLVRQTILRGGNLSGHDRSQVGTLVEAMKLASSNANGLETQGLPEAHEFASAAPVVGDQRVFLLENDAVLAADLSQQLEHFGYRVEIFDREEGMEVALVRDPPAAMIIDIVEKDGVLTGIEALSAINANLKSPPPAIMVTDRNDLATRLDSVRSGAANVFTKPIDIGELVEHLDRLTSVELPDPYRVLIVDDDPDLSGFFEVILQDSGIVTYVVNDPMLVMGPLSEFHPDVILMDINMPKCSGLELASVIRQSRAFLQIPIIFLTADANDENQLQAIRTGGDDFLGKPVKPSFMVSTVRARAERSRVLTSLISRDSMTGLTNHTKLKESLDSELDRAMRMKQPLAFVMIDLDNFKSVNDTYGHWVGDNVIKAMAQVLRQRLRKSDIIGRYGGEEFAAILPNTTGEQAVKIMDDIREGFGRIRHVSDGKEFFVTFSSGVSTYPPVEDPVLMTTSADDALYIAKKGGRNQVVMSTVDAQ